VNPSPGIDGAGCRANEKPPTEIGGRFRGNQSQ
jgi:hypothetical protein